MASDEWWGMRAGGWGLRGKGRELGTGNGETGYREQGLGKGGHRVGGDGVLGMRD